MCEQHFSAFLKSLNVSSDDELTMKTLRPYAAKVHASTKHRAVLPDPVSSWTSHLPERPGDEQKL